MRGKRRNIDAINMDPFSLVLLRPVGEPERPIGSTWVAPYLPATCAPRDSTPEPLPPPREGFAMPLRTHHRADPWAKSGVEWMGGV